MTSPSPSHGKVIAFLGKGGAGKTALSIMAARALIDSGHRPLLLVDADPTGGLSIGIGIDPVKTIGEVKKKIIDEAMQPDADREKVARFIDWLILETLLERDDYSLLAMGRTESKGCFCKLNAVLRSAIEKLASGFPFVIVDAEAGIEQVNRHVMERIDVPVIITEGSVRGIRAARLIRDLVPKYTSCSGEVGLIVNRSDTVPSDIPGGLKLWGIVPEDEIVRRFDREGLSLLDIPRESMAFKAMKTMVEQKILMP
jgi:CO dehydrogenase maturation factor